MRMVSWLIASCLASCLVAQDSSLVLKETFDISNSYFTTDRLQNIYVLDVENIIIKYNPKGQRLFDYNNQNYGTPSHIDASNPLRLLIYYKEYLTAVVLDRTLTELYTFHLQDYEINQSDVAATANDNGLWIFDNWSYQLKKINEQGTTERTSDDLNQLLNIQIEPNQLVLHDNKIYLNTPNEGILVFTLFGQYIETIPIRSIETFQVQNEHIIFYKGKELIHYSMRLKTSKQMIISNEKNMVQQVRVVGNYIFIGTDSEIKKYQYIK